MAVVDAVKLGTREGLEALRDKLAEAMDVAEPQVAAQIAGQLRQVLKDIAALGEQKQESKLDELQKRRAARLAGADAATPTERPAKQRSRRGS